MVDLTSLNPQQRSAVETVHGPVLILAGAGTGKTRVITYRIAHMIDHGIPAGQILGVTFTNKAAREMKERVYQLLPRSARSGDGNPKSGLTISTFHSLGVRILRHSIDRLGYKKNFVIYDEAEQLGVIKKLLSSISAKNEKIDPHAVLTMLSRYKNLSSEERRLPESSSAAWAEHIRSRYETALHACNAVDFDDLILFTLKLFQEHPDVLAACRGRYRYVMVDEYQDTNASQFQLVHQLTQEHRNLCVVGDDDQSIYGWRGAQIANLLELERYYPEVKIIKLEQNYRSTNSILTAANAVIKHNLRRRGKQLWSRKGQGEKILLRLFANEEEEARAVAENIECDRMARGIPWCKQAVLFRTNVQSRPLETALRQAGIRYHLIGGQSFFDRREVKDVLAYLKIFINPHDDNSLLRIANVPARGLSDVTLERLLAASHEQQYSVFAAMKNPAVRNSFEARAAESIAGFVSLVETIRAALLSDQALSLQVWSEQWLTQTGYLADLRRAEKDAETADNRIRNLRDLLASLDAEPKNLTKPMERLLTALEELMLDNERAEEKETQGDAVTLITMHSCKGLEFPHVQVVGLEDGLLPHTHAKDEGTMDEERRLFYVAITRAMQTLSLSHCQARKKFGQPVACHPSPFLKELPQDLVEWADTNSKKPVDVATGKKMFDVVRAAAG
jgi:superfamily I DNA/RNA helicase